MSSTILHTDTEISPESAASSEDKHPYLVGLGQRVGALRARRGMTRKALAAAAQVTVGGDPLIATAQVGKGRSLVWTSDIGPHWCPEPFVQWNGFAPLMSNMIDWVTGK